MATTYPAAQDTFTDPSTNNKLNSPSHSLQHSNANDAIIALEAKLGISASTPTASKVLRATGTGSSAWGQVQTSDITLLAITTALLADLGVTPGKIGSFDKIRLEQQVDQTLVNNTVLAIAFGTSSEAYKTNNSMHSTVTNNTRVTIQTAGKYHISGVVRYAGGNTTNRYETSIRVNGSNIIAANSIPATATSVYVSVDTVSSLAVNDYIELLGFQVTGGSITAQAATGTTPFTVTLQP